MGSIKPFSNYSILKTMKKIEILKNLLDKLRHYALALIAIEVTCTALIGLGASQVDKFLSPWTLLMIFSSFILIVILSYRYTYLKDFPSTLVELIKSDFSVQTLEKDYSRISLINDSIAKTLISLNSQTCQLQEQADGIETSNDEPIENKLCDKGIQQGLSVLIDSFLKNLHNIAESSQSKFTVGVYINWFLEIPSYSSLDYMDMHRSGTFILKDDLNIANNISEDIFEKKGAKEIELEIQSWITACYNNGHSQFHVGLRENDSLSIYANTIPVVCNEEAPVGVLFIIGNNLNVIPNDFDEVTRIHNRIISNWINKYNDCVSQKIQNAK